MTVLIKFLEYVKENPKCRKHLVDIANEIEVNIAQLNNAISNAKKKGIISSTPEKISPLCKRIKINAK